MLNLTKLNNDIRKLTNYHTQSENYYFKQASSIDLLIEKGIDVISSEPTEHVSIWGDLAASLGYSAGQNISQKEFEYLLDGKTAAGERYVKRHKNSGYDLTFSAPKTISIAGLVTEKNPDLVKAHDLTVQETMQEIQKHYSYAHPNSREHVKSDGMAWVSVRDGYSREHDPHLHTHIILTNITKYNGKYMALSASKMMNRDFNKLWGAFYRAKMGQKVKELGYDITYMKDGEWRLDKVSLACEKDFSIRSGQIKKEMQKGVSRKNAWRKTRKKKTNTVDKGLITNDWMNRAEKTNTLTPLENKKEAETERKRWIEEAEFNIEALQEREGRKNATEQERWLSAIERATQQSSLAREEAVIGEYIKELMASDSYDQIVSFDQLK